MTCSISGNIWDLHSLTLHCTAHTVFAIWNLKKVAIKSIFSTFAIITAHAEILLYFTEIEKERDRKLQWTSCFISLDLFPFVFQFSIAPSNQRPASRSCDHSRLSTNQCQNCLVCWHTDTESTQELTDLTNKVCYLVWKTINRLSLNLSTNDNLIMDNKTQATNWDPEEGWGQVRLIQASNYFFSYPHPFL